MRAAIKTKEFLQRTLEARRELVTLLDSSVNSL